MNDIKNKLFLLDKINTPLHIAVYGTGESAKILMKSLSALKKDVKISFFIDSFNEGTFEGYKVVKYDPNALYDVDYIVIASMSWLSIYENASHKDQLMFFPLGQEAIFKYKNKDKKELPTRKYFCIGYNKTGTTSLKKAFEQLDFVVGDQQEAMYIASKDYFSNKFDRLIEYCKRSEVFQDNPFSFPNTYKILDKAFPNSKFILTVRNSPEEWYKSFINYYTRHLGKDINKPISNERWEIISMVSPESAMIQKIYNAPQNDCFNKEVLIKSYNNHIKEVKNYFKNRPNDLLIINLADKDTYKKFTDFLGIKSEFDQFPWENKGCYEK